METGGIGGTGPARSSGGDWSPSAIVRPVHPAVASDRTRKVTCRSASPAPTICPRPSVADAVDTRPRVLSIMKRKPSSRLSAVVASRITGSKRRMRSLEPMVIDLLVLTGTAIDWPGTACTSSAAMTGGRV